MSLFRRLLVPKRTVPPVPVTPPPAVPAPAPAPDPARRTCPPNGRKVLIVDDDAIILKTTSLKLRSHGYAVVTASDGASAIGVVRREQPDLILLDLSFPPDVAAGGAVAWDGFVILSWLRRLDAARNTPVIIITAGDPARYKDKSLADGAFAFFPKPIDHDRLLATLEDLLGKKDCPGKPEPNTSISI